MGECECLGPRSCAGVSLAEHDNGVDDRPGCPFEWDAAGGWWMLIDVGALGLVSCTASDRLLVWGRVAATPMRQWGVANGDRFVRLVFSNEPPPRLAGLGRRVREALGP